MLKIVVGQSIFIPLLLSIVTLFICQRYYAKLYFRGLLLPVVWSVVYLWIIDIPALPPRQAIDWLWIVVFVSLILESTLLYFEQHKSIIFGFGLLLIISSLTLIWPVLSYNVSWNTHGFIWIEVFLSLSIFILALILNFSSLKQHQVFSQMLMFSLINGFVGVTTIVSGSMLLGLLSMALGSIYFASAIYYYFCKPSVIAVSTIILSLLLLLLARHYAEMPLLTFLLWLLAYLILLMSKLHSLTRMVGVLACSVCAIAWLMYVELGSYSYK